MPRGRVISLALVLLLCALCPARGAGAEAADALPALPELLEEQQLPVLEITTRDGELPGEEDAPGTLCVYGVDGGMISTPIEINLRGNTSRRFPKLSYRVKLVDERGKKRNLAIAGLRADDDWILNPMYADTSKVREAVSYWLWDEINSQPAATGTRVAYVEVFLNGAYHGLYGLQERVDRKQVDADRRSGVLYKVIANDQPAVEELLQWDDEAPCRGIELVFSGTHVARPWLPAADYMAFLLGQEAPGGARLSVDNAVDYGLWAMLTQARDCHFKNQFIHAVRTEEGYVLYRIPWDVNHTLGDLWDGDAEAQNFTEYYFLSLTEDDVFERLVASGDAEFRRAVRARWAALRDGAITAENIVGRARALFDGLSPAIERDTLRWPACGMGEGNAANIRDIEAFFADVLPRMDAWVADLTDTSEETGSEEDGAGLDR